MQANTPPFDITWRKKWQIASRNLASVLRAKRSEVLEGVQNNYIDHVFQQLYCLRDAIFNWLNELQSEKLKLRKAMAYLDSNGTVEQILIFDIWKFY
jgi:hypothetical protein